MKHREFRRLIWPIGILLMSVSPIPTSAVDTPAATAPIPFSTRAEALPFPPDAREVEFDATFDEIEFTSGSSLASLAEFYQRELLRRGWIEDPSALEGDEERLEKTFNHEGAQLLLELDVQSDWVAVSLECEGLDFSQTSDPAALIAAGVPQPRSYVFLQKEVPRPSEIQDVEYSSDSCHFKSPLALQAAFDFYNQALPGKGWRESRRPIVTEDRRYTEFTRGPEEMSVNVFTHEVGSRIILGYESQNPEPIVPPLNAVPATAIPGLAEKLAKEEAARTAVDVSRNMGSATVTLAGTKYIFKHVAAYRTQDDGDETTRLVFSEQPIPLPQLQAKLVKEGNVSFGDLYENSYPGHLELTVRESVSFYFNVGGTAMGNSIDNPESTLKVDKERVQGGIKMREPQEHFDDKVLIELSLEAGVLTPQTKLAKPAP